MVTANAASRCSNIMWITSRACRGARRRGSRRLIPIVVWLSEMMLQQTTVAAVRPQFERFVTRWPTIENLAAATDEEILSEWAGLGYYARARNLTACAREVARRGAFPTTAAALRQLPGIGDYTSAAIAAIAFDEKAAAVDTNVQRVVARLHALREPSKDQVATLLLDMLPDGRTGDFTQAMMDLGATICRPKAPMCSKCPLQPHCLAFRNGQPEHYPALKVRRQRPHKYGAAYWTERNGEVWLVRRPPKGMLGGMAALPGSEWTDAPFKISIQSAPCAMSSPISRSICRSCSRRSRLQKAGGIRSSEFAGRASDPLSRAAEIALAEQKHAA